MNRDAACDAAQEATYRALRNESAYDGSRPLRPWFLKIARNVALDEARRRRRLCDLAADVSHHETPLDRLIALETCNIALREMRQLRPAYREALTLKCRGYRYREIADELGVPIGTAQTLVHRAQLILRERCRVPITPAL